MSFSTSRHVTLEQRFGNKELQALKRTKFPQEFSLKVDVRKVNVAVLKPWIVETTQRMLGGVEDDILVEFVSEMLEDKEVPVSPPNGMGELSASGTGEWVAIIEQSDNELHSIVLVRIAAAGRWLDYFRSWAVPGLTFLMMNPYCLSIRRSHFAPSCFRLSVAGSGPTQDADQPRRLHGFRLCRQIHARVMEAALVRAILGRRCPSRIRGSEKTRIVGGAGEGSGFAGEDGGSRGKTGWPWWWCLGDEDSCRVPRRAEREGWQQQAFTIRSRWTSSSSSTWR